MSLVNLTSHMGYKLIFTLFLGALKLGRPPESSLSLRRVRAAPSPTLHQGSSTLPSNARNNRTKTEYSNPEDDPRRSPDNEIVSRA